MAQLSGDGAGSAASRAPAAKSAAPSAQLPADFPALIKRLESAGKHHLAIQLHDQVGLVRFAPPELALKPLRPLGGDWPREAAAALKAVTGSSWNIVLSDEAGEPSLLDREKMAEERVRSDVLADPNLRAVMDSFPDAELESFSTRGA
jgi:DNA polymerase-3 subunit gamma/tau